MDMEIQHPPDDGLMDAGFLGLIGANGNGNGNVNKRGLGPSTDPSLRNRLKTVTSSLLALCSELLSTSEERTMAVGDSVEITVAETQEEPSEAELKARQERRMQEFENHFYPRVRMREAVETWLRKKIVVERIRPKNLIGQRQNRAARPSDPKNVQRQGPEIESQPHTVFWPDLLYNQTHLTRRNCEVRQEDTGRGNRAV